MSHQDNMRAVCEEIHEIKRIAKEATQQLTNNEKKRIREYRKSIGERIGQMNDRPDVYDTFITICRGMER